MVPKGKVVPLVSLNVFWCGTPSSAQGFASKVPELAIGSVPTEIVYKTSKNRKSANYFPTFPAAMGGLFSNLNSWVVIGHAWGAV